MAFEYIVGIIVAIVLFLAIIVLYNGFVAKRNRVQDAWAQIDVQLKRRYDLIPNLINTVKGYAGYERGVLTKVTQLRSSIITGSVQQKADANNQISQALKSIFAVAENYPDLKASANFQQLQTALEDTEDKIAFVRTSYNDYVLDYNNAIQQFPGNMFAGMFHFTRKDFFQAPPEAAGPVKVDFSDLNAPAPGAVSGPGTSQKAPKSAQKPT
ncbi:LemA family protein [Candidatus Marsarchaeota archaeon]|nr:LemA family protein [Candidatus Marsarchaeota archaeon]